MTSIGVYSQLAGANRMTLRTLLSPFESISDAESPVFAVTVSARGAPPPYEEKFEGWYATTNYAGNGMVLSIQADGQIGGMKSIKDGNANTIMLAERLQICGKPGQEVPTLWGMAAFSAATASFALATPDVNHPHTVEPHLKLQQFVPPANPPADFVYPPGFQVTPKRGECDARILHALHPNGLLVCMFDGSTHVINRNVSPRTFWAAVTPAGREDLGADW